MKNIHVRLMEGVGDQLYSRPFIKELSKTHTIYLEAVLPSLFKDIENIKYVDPNKVTYRTQQKQRKSESVEYHKVPEGTELIHPYYTGEDLNTKSIIAFMYDKFKIPYSTELEWSLPDFSDEFREFEEQLPSNQKIAIIRPATIRAEWIVETRNPNPNYIAWCCKVLNEAGYYTISIADLEVKKEWLAEGIDTPAQLKLHKGELGIYGTLELLKRASIVVGGSGFIIPASACANVPQFIMFGGRMKFDSVYKVFHPSMNLKQIGYAIPDNPCKCTFAKHNCDKTISNLDERFYDFLRTIND